MPVPALLIAGIALQALSGIANYMSGKSQRDALERAQQEYAASILGVPVDQAGERIPLKVAQHLMLKGQSGYQLPTYKGMMDSGVRDALTGVSGAPSPYASPATRALASGFDVQSQGKNAMNAQAWRGMDMGTILGYQKAASDFRGQQNALLAHNAMQALPPPDYSGLASSAYGIANTIGNWYLNRNGTTNISHPYPIGPTQTPDANGFYGMGEFTQH